MDIGFGTGPYHEAIADQAEGFDFAEITIGEQEVAPENVDTATLQRRLAEKGLDLVVHLPFRQPLATTVDAFNDAVIEYFDTLLAFAGDLGAEKAVIHANMRDRGDGEQHAILRRQIERLHTGDTHGVECCFENVDHKDTPPVLDLSEILDDVGAPMCFDIGHAYQASNLEDVDAFLERYADIISHIHAHDIRKRGDTHILIDEGTIDFQHVAEHLQGFDGTACIEVFTGDPEYNRIARDRFRSYFT